MDDWPFILGQLYSHANWIHRNFFIARGHRPPPLLLGQRYVLATYSNPRSAFSGFQQAFQPCFNWTESQFAHRNKLNGYKKMLTRILELTGGDIPSSLTDEQKILLGSGYQYFRPKTDEKPVVSNS